MYALQSVETAMIGTIMSISTICINVCINYCLIYGNFGAPELGIVGAAIASLISRIVELGIILIYVLFIDKKLKMKLMDILQNRLYISKGLYQGFNTNRIKWRTLGCCSSCTDDSSWSY